MEGESWVDAELERQLQAISVDDLETSEEEEEEEEGGCIARSPRAHEVAAVPLTDAC